MIIKHINFSHSYRAKYSLFKKCLDNYSLVNYVCKTELFAILLFVNLILTFTVRPIDGFIKEQNKENVDNRYFVAAVYEHARLGEHAKTPAEPLMDLEKNLKVYEEVANIAAKKGAMILVYPEAGLYKIKSRLDSFQVFESVPNPRGPNAKFLYKQLRPCDYPEYSVERPIQLRMSCLAQQTQMYIVINMGTKESCQPSDSLLFSQTKNRATALETQFIGQPRHNYVILPSSQNYNFQEHNWIVPEQNNTNFESRDCPVDGRWNYNTNVVFAPDGSIVARYHKRHLFLEEKIYDVPAPAERVYFDTPFGRFGLIVCFDLVFGDPAVQLVELDHVDTIIMSTRWYDEMPLFSAISSQAAWSSSFGVNLLAANSHNVQVGTVGSGIYASKYGPVIYKGVDPIPDSTSTANETTLLDRILQFLFGSENNDKSKTKHKIRSSSVSRLLVGVLPRASSSNANISNSFEQPKFLKDSLNSVINILVTQNSDKNPIKPIEEKKNKPRYHYMSMKLTMSDIQVPLNRNASIVNACNSEFCCQLEYKFNDSIKNTQNHAKNLNLLVRNSLRPGPYQWYEQICSFAVSQNSFKKNEEMKFSIDDGVQFEYLRFKANFSTPYVMAPASSDVATLIPVQNLNLNCKSSNKDTGLNFHDFFHNDSHLEKSYQRQEKSNTEKINNECTLELENYHKPIINAALYGRVYWNDQIDMMAKVAEARTFSILDHPFLNS